MLRGATWAQKGSYKGALIVIYILYIILLKPLFYFHCCSYPMLVLVVFNLRSSGSEAMLPIELVEVGSLDWDYIFIVTAVISIKFAKNQRFNNNES